MRYVSTRGEAPVLGFLDTLLAGLARDGGLYVPAAWPTLDGDTLAGLAGRPYHEVAARVIGPYVGGEIGHEAFDAMVREAYAGFRHPAVAPLVQIGAGLFVEELFHGPTLAFKDVAMQLLARLMDHALSTRGRRATIVGATSGDTGSAAMEAFAGLPSVDVVILYPQGRVSEVQRRQMTAIAAPNVHAVAIEGTFDDAQALVKAMFNHHAFRDELQLSGVNSINWARIVAQVVYYVTAAVALGSPHRPVSFAVPTGNFGDVFAGYVAKRMGLPIDRLVVATNENDILARALTTGSYEARAVVPTSSPSMDIQVSSNFERLLFDACGREPETVRAMMGALHQSGSFALPPDLLAIMACDVEAARTDEVQTHDTIRRVWRESGYLLDPHTAVAVSAAERSDGVAGVPMVTLGTAHPSKFPDAVERATGLRPALPPHLADLMDRPERIEAVPAELAAVEAFVRSRSRAVSGVAA